MDARSRWLSKNARRASSRRPVARQRPCNRLRPQLQLLRALRPRRLRGSRPAGTAARTICCGLRSAMPVRARSPKPASRPSSTRSSQKSAALWKPSKQPRRRQRLPLPATLHLRRLRPLLLRLPLQLPLPLLRPLSPFAQNGRALLLRPPRVPRSRHLAAQHVRLLPRALRPRAFRRVRRSARAPQATIRVLRPAQAAGRCRSTCHVRRLRQRPAAATTRAPSRPSSCAMFVLAPCRSRRRSDDESRAIKLRWQSSYACPVKAPVC